MGIFSKLKKAQSKFDENWIMKHKDYWKKKFQKLSVDEMKKKLREIEIHPQFESTKSSKRVVWYGGLGAAMHVGDREKESQRRALRELLGVK